MAKMTPFEREIQKNAGKVVSNLFFGNAHATPIKVLRAEESAKRKQIAENARHSHKIDTMNRASELRKEEKMLAYVLKEKEKKSKEDAIKQQTERNLQEVEDFNSYLMMIKSMHKEDPTLSQWGDDSSLKEYLQMDPDDIDETVLLKSIRENNGVNELLKTLISIESNPDVLINDVKCSSGKEIKNFEKFIKNEKSAIGDHDEESKVSAYFLLSELKNKISDLIKNEDHSLREVKDSVKREIKEYKLIDDFFSLINTGVRTEEYFNGVSGFLSSINAFAPIKDFGSFIDISCDGEICSIDYIVKDSEIIPEVKKTTQLNKKTKDVKESVFKEQERLDIYQDYVCSAAIKIGRDFLSALPLEEKGVVTALRMAVNSSTGQYEKEPIMSVIFSRDKFDSINFEMIDPSDALESMNCRMDFDAKKGFSVIDRFQLLTPEQ